MIKAVFYWGFYVIIENNKGWLYTEFKQHGLENFLLVRQKDGSITPWIPYEEHHGGNKPISTDEAMINAYMFAIKKYIAVPHKDCQDYLVLIKTLKLLHQLMDFNPLDTRRFDLAVAIGFWRIAVESYTIWLLHNKDKKKEKSPFNAQVLKALLG